LYGYKEVAATDVELVEGEGGTADRCGRGVRRGRVGLVGAAAVGLVLAEVQLAKRHVGNGHAPYAPRADGLYGYDYTGAPA
jgi:hypothetical protein